MGDCLFSSDLRVVAAPLERLVDWVLGAVSLLDVQALYYVFGAFITGNLTLVTVVVSINQLLLSRELQTPGELRFQMEAVIDYRRDVEAATGRLAPVQPLGSLRDLFEETRQETQRLGCRRYDGVAEPTADAIDDEVTELTERMGGDTPPGTPPDLDRDGGDRLTGPAEVVHIPHRDGDEPHGGDAAVHDA